MHGAGNSRGRQPWPQAGEACVGSAQKTNIVSGLLTVSETRSCSTVFTVTDQVGNGLFQSVLYRQCKDGATLSLANSKLIVVRCLTPLWAGAPVLLFPLISFDGSIACRTCSTSQICQDGRTVARRKRLVIAPVPAHRIIARHACLGSD